MASSQTTSFTEKKKESIIDGRLFIQSVFMERVQTENNDVVAMEHVVSRIKQNGLFNLGRQHSDLYDESSVEELYWEDSVRFHSVKKGGDMVYILIGRKRTSKNRALFFDFLANIKRGRSSRDEFYQGRFSQGLLNRALIDFSLSKITKKKFSRGKEHKS
ncbi:hypothetical protein OROMI_014615 [Orobanche minor]